MLILCFSSTIAVFFDIVGKIVAGILGFVTLLLIIYFIVKVSTTCSKTKNEFKHSQINSVQEKPKNIVTAKVQVVEPKPRKSISDEIEKEPIAESQPINKEFQHNASLKNLYELWREMPAGEKCLTATNHENPDLKWVKIYKPPYGNGKFYGYVLMKNARHTVNGEIYFANRKIWELVK